MTLVILAAGMGSRYGGLKQLEPFTENGEFIIDFSVFEYFHKPKLFDNNIGDGAAHDGTDEKRQYVRKHGGCVIGHKKFGNKKCAYAAENTCAENFTDKSGNIFFKDHI